MSDNSAIQWTDATWNPTTGCTKISPGCAHCYIERTPAFRIKDRKFVDGAIPLHLHADRLEQPLHWKKPRRVFVNSLSDLFHEDVPDAFIDQVFAVMALAPQHTFQVLTKRPARMREYLAAFDVYERISYEATVSTRANVSGIGLWPLQNVWLGVSVENQHFADERIPLLLQTPAAVRFISAEPLLGPVELMGLFVAHFENPADDAVLDWVIVGGESGPGARPFNLAWGRAIVVQCQTAGVPVFVKQLGAWPRTVEFPTDVTVNGFPISDRPAMAGDRLLLHDRKGGDMDEWPADLRVREFPEVRG